MEKDTGSGSKSACRSWDAGWMHGCLFCSDMKNDVENHAFMG